MLARVDFGTLQVSVNEVFRSFYKLIITDVNELLSSCYLARLKSKAPSRNLEPYYGAGSRATRFMDESLPVGRHL